MEDNILPCAQILGQYVTIDMKYLVREGEGVWSQSKVVSWEMSWEELSHQ